MGFFKPDSEPEAITQYMGQGEVFKLRDRDHNVANLKAFARPENLKAFKAAGGGTFAYECPTTIGGESVINRDGTANFRYDQFPEGRSEAIDALRAIQKSGVHVVLYDKNPPESYKGDAAIGYSLMQIKNLDANNVDQPTRERVTEYMHDRLRANGISKSEAQAILKDDAAYGRYFESFLEQRIDPAKDRESGAYLAEVYHKLGPSRGKMFDLHGDAHSYKQNDQDEAFSKRMQELGHEPPRMVMGELAVTSALEGREGGIHSVEHAYPPAGESPAMDGKRLTQGYEVYSRQLVLGESAGDYSKEMKLNTPAELPRYASEAGVHQYFGDYAEAGFAGLGGLDNPAKIADGARYGNLSVDGKVVDGRFMVSYPSLGDGDQKQLADQFVRNLNDRYGEGTASYQGFGTVPQDGKQGHMFSLDAEKGSAMALDIQRYYNGQEGQATLQEVKDIARSRITPDSRDIYDKEIANHQQIWKDANMESNQEYGRLADATIKKETDSKVEKAAASAYEAASGFTGADLVQGQPRSAEEIAAASAAQKGEEAGKSAGAELANVMKAPEVVQAPKAEAEALRPSIGDLRVAEAKQEMAAATENKKFDDVANWLRDNQQPASVTQEALKPSVGDLRVSEAKEIAEVSKTTEASGGLAAQAAAINGAGVAAAGASRSVSAVARQENAFTRQGDDIASAALSPERQVAKANLEKSLPGGMMDYVNSIKDSTAASAAAAAKQMAEQKAEQERKAEEAKKDAPEYDGKTALAANQVGSDKKFKNMDYQVNGGGGGYIR